jgi:hypothetical protein
MSYLAKKERDADALHQAYLIHHPGCARFQELADRGDEHFLQKNLGISRNVCLDKTADYQNGDWQAAFPPMTVHLPTFYEKWTRAKNAKLQCQSTERPACFATFNPEPFPGPCGFTRGTFS